MSDHLQQQIDELKAEVEALRLQIIAGPPRLGPRPQSQEDVVRQANQLADAVQKARVDLQPVDRSNVCTTNGKPVAEVRANQTSETGQHDGYIVLCDAERAKGFVRPLRRSYRHDGCGTVTTMGLALCETYARDPTFYGATFCVGCNRHLPVAEFVWSEDGQRVGS